MLASEAMEASYRRSSTNSRVLMTLKGFGAWKAAIRLLSKRFYTTKTLSGPSRCIRCRSRASTQDVLPLNGRYHIPHMV